MEDRAAEAVRWDELQDRAHDRREADEMKSQVAEKFGDDLAANNRSQQEIEGIGFKDVSERRPLNLMERLREAAAGEGVMAEEARKMIPRVEQARVSRDRTERSRIEKRRAKRRARKRNRKR